MINNEDKATKGDGKAGSPLANSSAASATTGEEEDCGTTPKVEEQVSNGLGAGVEKSSTNIYESRRVLTKTGDGGRHVNYTSSNGEHVNQNDPFLRYSDNNVRMRYLLGLMDEDTEAANGENRDGNNEDRADGEEIIDNDDNADRDGQEPVGQQEGNSRRTRISFELHYGRALEDLMFREQE